MFCISGRPFEEKTLESEHFKKLVHQSGRFDEESSSALDDTRSGLSSRSDTSAKILDEPKTTLTSGNLINNQLILKCMFSLNFQLFPCIMNQKIDHISEQIKNGERVGSFDVWITNFRDLDDFHCVLARERSLVEAIQRDLAKDVGTFQIMHTPRKGTSRLKTLVHV